MSSEIKRSISNTLYYNITCEIKRDHLFTNIRKNGYTFLAYSSKHTLYLVLFNSWIGQTDKSANSKRRRAAARILLTQRGVLRRYPRKIPLRTTIHTCDNPSLRHPENLSRNSSIKKKSSNNSTQLTSSLPLSSTASKSHPRLLEFPQTDQNPRRINYITAPSL